MSIKSRTKPQPKPLPEYVSRQQLAEAIGVHPESIKRLEREGKIPRAIRITSKIIRYERSAIEQFLKEAR